MTIIKVRKVLFGFMNRFIKKNKKKKNHFKIVLNVNENNYQFTTDINHFIIQLYNLKL